MPLSWNEIKNRALAFSREWSDAKDEKSEAQRFWIAFFDIFGFTKQRVFAFEHAITKQGSAYKGNRGWIDLLWPGVLLVEHKSRGKDHSTLLMQDILNWLSRVNAQYADNAPTLAFEAAMQAMQGADSIVYMRLTDEALAMLKWLRQFADSVGTSDGD